MNVKIDTKEKFTVITPQEKSLSANMAEDLNLLLRSYAEKDPPHLIVNMTSVNEIDKTIAETLADVHAWYYADNHSFVLCEMNKVILKVFEENDLLDTLNVTPTESEAWDIVQMEEIERELMSGFDEEGE